MAINKHSVYKHYKTGKLYRVVDFALHSETLEQLVIYECMHENNVSKIWARPIGMFEEAINYNDKQVNRFSEVTR